MYGFVRSELEKLNIDLVSCLHLDECIVKRPYLLEKYGIKKGSVIIFAVPYLPNTDRSKQNVSSYAIGRDYHLFFSSLFGEMIKKLKIKYPDNIFAAFTDHSPIDEINAALRAGLGIHGKNHLLITEKYSSYVFIGEIITDAELPSFFGDIKECIGCNACLNACPVNMDTKACLSALTQKKGPLTEDEKSMIKSHGCAWGCDRCQNVCPYTKSAISRGTVYTRINYFNEELTPHLTSELIEGMNDDDFAARAYSWRGKNTVLRNLKILEGKEL